MRYQNGQHDEETREQSFLIHVDEVKVEGRSQLDGDRSQTLLGKRDKSHLAFSDASTGSTSPHSRSSTSSLTPFFQYVMLLALTGNWLPLPYNIFVQSRVGTRLHVNVVWVLARRVRSIESTGGELDEIQGPRVDQSDCCIYSTTIL